MKRFSILTVLIFVLISCGNRAPVADKETHQPLATATQETGKDIVHVYYFHGKQRCKTCIAVGEVTEQTIKTTYPNQPNIRFIEVETHNSANAALVEKYQVTWNALIIDKEGDTSNITQQAFALAVGQPEKLAGLIQSEVNKRR